MFSDGADAPFRFMDAILMFALMLFFFLCGFSCMFPWVLGLFPSIGRVSPGWGWAGNVFPFIGSFGGGAPSGCSGI